MDEHGANMGKLYLSVYINMVWISHVMWMSMLLENWIWMILLPNAPHMGSNGMRK